MKRLCVGKFPLQSFFIQDFFLHIFVNLNDDNDNCLIIFELQFNDKIVLFISGKVKQKSFNWCQMTQIFILI